LQTITTNGGKIMDDDDKIITNFPVNELFKSNNKLTCIKRQLNKDEIIEIIKTQPIEFVIADIGLKLEWIDIQDCYNFWKQEISNNFAFEEPIHLDNFNNNYCFWASKWKFQNEEIVILLEKLH
jgi:hypothetical protein